MKAHCSFPSLAVPALLVLAGCGSRDAHPPAAKAAPPAKVEVTRVREADLARITLTPQAVERLGIQLADAEFKDARQVRTFAGEVVIPPGQIAMITSPVTGTLRASGSGALAPGAHLQAGQAVLQVLPMAPVERNLRVGFEADAATAAARVEAARSRLQRAERLLRDQVGSAKAVETAREELAIAEAAYKAARQKLEQASRAPFEVEAPVPIAAPQAGVVRQILAAPGQTVSAGAALVEVVALDPVWLRVPVYSGELPALQRGARAEVRRLGASPSSPAQWAEPIEAPPSADPQAATSDLYFRLPNPGSAFRPGEKLSVTLPLHGAQKRLQVPWSSIVYDMNGGAWVYEAAAPNVFLRRRVEVDYVTGASAVLVYGPEPGARVVAAGAAELFGTEFGAGK